MFITPIIFVIGILDNQWDCSDGCLVRKTCNSDLIGQCAQQYTDIAACKYYCIVYYIQI